MFTARRRGCLENSALALVATLTLPFGAVIAQTPGSMARDRARLAEITGEAGDTGATSPEPALSRERWHVHAVRPELLIVWNSAIPFSANDGPLWAGRGLSSSVTGGVAATYAAPSFTIRAVLAPTVTYAQNLAFEIQPGGEPGRSVYSSPWHVGRASADLPLRFGNQPLRSVDLGQSSLMLDRGPVAFGISSTSEWWGPGIRNALVMSDNAAGIPRVFVATARPYETWLGAVEAELIVGTLTKSLFFDSVSTTDYRALSGFRATVRPRWIRTLSVGVARVVYAPASDAMGFLEQPIRALTYWRSMNNERDTLPDGRSAQKADQILALVARWIFPESGVEVYGEWARMAVPRSLSDVVTTPGNTRASTAGLQWVVRTPSPGRRVRLQAEVSNLEQTVYDASRPPPDFYAGRAAPEGYTQRGQVIGAAIGPGGSSQWLAGDVLLPTSHVGLFVGRIRWENDAFYRQPFTSFLRHDVSVFTGVRGGTRLPSADISAQITITHRYNYLFQNGAANPGGYRTVDIHNVTLSARVAPR
jgi:hypothetical protein